MKAFFNTSPIIFLEKLGIMDTILPKLWDEIFLTGAVVKEINDSGIIDRSYFRQYQVRDKIAVLAMPQALHAGETETIIGAIETGVNYIVLDDSKARKKADSLGIKTLGTLGVLVVARMKKIITSNDAVKYLQELRKNSFWIEEKFYQQILRQLNRVP